MREKKIKNRRSAGLTLMELIICMAVMGTLLTIASPLVGQFSSGFRLRGAAREVATDLQFARLLAVKENNEFKVVITSNSYDVVKVGGTPVTVKSRNFSIDYPEVALTPATVRFNSRGNCVSGATTTIAVSNPQGTKNITVVSTGRVKMG